MLARLIAWLRTPTQPIVTGYQPRGIGPQAAPPRGGSGADTPMRTVVFREGVFKKGGLNPDPTDYRPPPPASFHPARTIPLTTMNIPMPAGAKTPPAGPCECCGR